MEAHLEQFLAKEMARLELRISSRQPIESRMRQLVWHMCPTGTTEDEITAMMSLLMMRFQGQPRMVTRSMVKRG